MLDGHDFFAKKGVKVITDRCLVTVSKRELLICYPNLVLGLCPTLKARSTTFIKKSLEKK